MAEQRDRDAVWAAWRAVIVIDPDTPLAAMPLVAGWGSMSLTPLRLKLL
jgi:hypothetical protein